MNRTIPLLCLFTAIADVIVGSVLFAPFTAAVVVGVAGVLAAAILGAVTAARHSRGPMLAVAGVAPLLVGVIAASTLSLTFIHVVEPERTADVAPAAQR